jgi:hypothetical protein
VGLKLLMEKVRKLYTNLVVNLNLEDRFGNVGIHLRN